MVFMWDYIVQRTCLRVLVLAVGCGLLFAVVGLVLLFFINAWFSLLDNPEVVQLPLETVFANILIGAALGVIAGWRHDGRLPI